MEILDPDTFLQLLVENGFCSVPSHRPQPINIKPASKVPKPAFSFDHPINKYKRSEMTEADLCNVLGIKKDELLRYLVEHGVLF